MEKLMQDLLPEMPEAMAKVNLSALADANKETERDHEQPVVVP